MIAKIITSVMLIAILGAFLYLNVNIIYAAPYIRLSVPLSEDEHQFLPNQLAFHMDNQTNGGAVEVVSNETGQNVTQYFKYNPDRNSVTVSNSTLTADFAIQIPDLNNPNIVKINKIDLPLLDVYSITKYNVTLDIPYKAYQTLYKNVLTSDIPYKAYQTLYKNIPITIGNTTYNGIDMYVFIPEDREQYNMEMAMYLHP